MSNSDQDTVDLELTRLADVRQEHDVQAPTEPPHLIVLSGSNSGVVFRLEEGQTVIGRGVTARIHLTDEHLSRAHARLVYQNDAVVIEDLKSANGTTVNGVPLKAEQHLVLRHGDIIRLGNLTFLKFVHTNANDESFRIPNRGDQGLDTAAEAFKRMLFLDQLALRFAYARRHGGPLALLMVSIDHFARGDDRLGSGPGNDVLANAARILQGIAPAKDIVARYSRDELAVICPRTAPRDAGAIAERMRQSVEAASFTHDGAKMAITISIGIAAYPDTRFENTSQLIASALSALVAAKRMGGNQVRHASEGLPPGGVDPRLRATLDLQLEGLPHGGEDQEPAQADLDGDTVHTGTSALHALETHPADPAEPGSARVPPAPAPSADTDPPSARSRDSWETFGVVTRRPADLAPSSSRWRQGDKPIHVFFSYAPEDETSAKELDKHLASLQRSGKIHAFYASQIGAGAEFRKEIDARIEAAQIFLLLVSADFLASDTCHAELARALSRNCAGEARVIPIIVRDCDWKSASFAQLSKLPRGSRTIASAPSRDEAWAEVVSGIRTAVEWLAEKPQPHYPDPATKVLSEQIETARARRERLRQYGTDTAEVDREIRDLRRQLREGGQLRAGDALGNGRYLLLKQVGRGGFGTVWEAHDRERHDRVAVKVLHSNLAGDQLRLERFFRGARIMAELDHDFVVRVLEKRCEDGGYYYFVMEFVAGSDLKRAVLAKTLPVEFVLPSILRVGQALAIAHRKGFVHRDVKPANILLDAARTPRLTDFDLVGVSDSTGGTRTGALGTVVYTAPEITDRPQDADARADVYSLAMTAVFGLHGAELSLLMVLEINEIVNSINCNDAVKRVLKRALAWNKLARFEDAAVFCEALRHAIAGY